MLKSYEIPIKEVLDARKVALVGDEAWKLLVDAAQVLIARGKGYQVFDPRTDSKEVLLAQALGRTGNLRAPSLRIGDQLWVGFGEGLYTRLAGF